MTYLLKHVRARRAVGDDDTFWSDVDTIMRGGAIPASQADATDLITQTATGGSTSTADFTSVGGVCKAMNLPALAAVRGLQGQLNRVAQVKGYSKIAADGAIGPATMALFRLVQAAAGSGTIMAIRRPA